MSSTVTHIYIKGMIYKGDDGVTFEEIMKTIKIRHYATFNTLKKKIHNKVKLEQNKTIYLVTSKFLVSNNFITL